MHPRKEQSAKEIYNIVDQYCEANIRAKYHTTSAISFVLGISDTVAQKLINKIVIALPDCFFYLAKPEQINEMINFIAQQYLLFQAQENINDELFPSMLINFVNNLVEEIMLRYYSFVEAGDL
ncbi:hypothetical protein [Legionella longbeachae]|uniref:Uncharacterized protein n=1 Tax=Legionella longbeachae serogroup 1 (strain NSW150) TaxID=661367 RepID=D3HNA1_LEGLN|nr:hypothetical protein [Legionella longbeachae]VEE00890.1 Uncharacterised protein [Legionella oakridgensis]HBD7399007.1 hypothetical protein [Legionella pneumophila]ARB92714.1 hypothetical protein A6J40_11240 [Legionella longbeachae]ARM34110.1 hypothetical protein B0B39_11485 [Legionella longbeachae]EEZ96654.1 hypothetical protein LLB_1850 [Legionella longbeachae D-4968]